MRRLSEQLETSDGNKRDAELLRGNDFKATKKSATMYSLYVNQFFMKRIDKFMKTVIKEALGIEHYWGRIKFAPGRGQIHLHMLEIAKDRAYLDNFYHAKTNEAKAEVL